MSGRALGLTGILGAALLMRVPSFDAPLSRDEAGFLLVADQWRPGSSLYGDYWVDRPPVLIGLFDLAGGAVGLRLLGCLAVVAAVLLAARLGVLLAPHVTAAPLVTAATAAVFLSTPLFGAILVNGEHPRTAELPRGGPRPGSWRSGRRA